jgi:hypothetical protein
MKKQFVSYLLAITVAIISTSLCAQDLHFSQFFHSPLTTNPANTGFIPEGDYRLGVNYRDQWSSIMTVPYKTMSAFGDIQLFRDRLENGWVRFGVVVVCLGDPSPKSHS